MIALTKSTVFFDNSGYFQRYELDFAWIIQRYEDLYHLS